MVEGRKLYKPLLIRVLCLNRTYCIYLCCSSKVKQKGTDGAKPRRGTTAMWPIHSAYSCFPSAVCLSCPCEMGRPSPRLGDRPARDDTRLTLARRVRPPFAQGEEILRKRGSPLRMPAPLRSLRHLQGKHPCPRLPAPCQLLKPSPVPLRETRAGTWCSLLALGVGDRRAGGGDTRAAQGRVAGAWAGRRLAGG